MKKYFKFQFLFFALALFFTSCQNESVEVINPSEQEAIVPDSSLFEMMQRTSSNKGLNYETLDIGGCFSVKLPISLIFEGKTYIIQSEQDFEDLDEQLDDDDDVDLVFPITIVYSDYSEVLVESSDELQQFADECDGDGFKQCISFVYPISISLLNTSNVVIDKITIESNAALYTFLEELDEMDSVLAALNYPISMQYANGEKITVNSNDELSNVISESENSCGDDNYFECFEYHNLYYSGCIDISGFALFSLYEAVPECNEYAGQVAITFHKTFEGAETRNNFIENAAAYTPLSASEMIYIRVELVSDPEEYYVFGVELISEYCTESCVKDNHTGFLLNTNWQITEYNSNLDYNNFQFDFKQNDELVIFDLDTNTSQNATYTTFKNTEGATILSVQNILEGAATNFNGEWTLLECNLEGMFFMTADGNNYFYLDIL